MLLDDTSTIDKDPGNGRMLPAALITPVCALQSEDCPIGIDESWLMKSLTGYEVACCN